MQRIMSPVLNLADISLAGALKLTDEMYTRLRTGDLKIQKGKNIYAIKYYKNAIPDLYPMSWQYAAILLSVKSIQEILSYS